MPSSSKPAKFSESLLASAIGTVSAHKPDARPVRVTTCAAHSNDRAEISFSDGDTLVIKRARHDWAAEGFAVSRAASALIRRHTDLLVPVPLDLGLNALESLPIEAYWRLNVPTLAQAWPEVPRDDVRGLLRQWGRLIARLHSIRLPGHGTLVDGADDTLAHYLESDLGGRLLPAMEDVWPAAAGLVESLAHQSRRVADRVDDRGVLVHNDLHLDNVLCRKKGSSMRLVGFLDLEAAFAGPPEADFAQLGVLHGPHLGRPLRKGWMDDVRDGYGRELDPVVIAYFRAVAMANLGYHAALYGWTDHADNLLQAARGEELHRLQGTGCRGQPATALDIAG